MSTGRIFTFYSYKGGAGRTMALANVGALLAEWGHRVLCIDWDLEAPGLDRYLLPRSARRDSDGLVDLITRFAAGDAPRWQACITPCPLESGATLDIMHAGREDAGFLARMQAIDWERLYHEQGLGHYIETLRAQWIDAYDFVLIDSRTGITDAGGICTAQLPDEMVVLFIANSQSIDGALHVIDLAEKRRDTLPVDRPRMLILPLISRFELRVEYEEAREWLDEFERRLRPHLERWNDPADVKGVLNLLRVPYVPYWSFGERLAVVKRGTDDPDDIGHSYASIAALLVNGFAAVEQLRGNRDALLARARTRRADEAIRYDVLILGERRDHAYIDALADALGRRARVAVRLDDDTAAEPVDDADLFAASSNYVVPVGRRWHPARDGSLERALAVQATSATPRRIVPLALGAVTAADLPPPLRRLVVLRPEASAADTADAIRALLDGLPDASATR